MSIKEEFKEMFECIFVPSLVISVLMFIVLSFIALGASYDCYSYGNLISKDSKTVLLECYVKTDNGWLKRDTFELTQIFGPK